MVFKDNVVEREEMKTFTNDVLAPYAARKVGSPVILQLSDEEFDSKIWQPSLDQSDHNGNGKLERDEFVN